MLLFRKMILSLLLSNLFFICSSLFAGSCIIEGYVRDADSGNPIDNVNVFLKGTTRGAATDSEGYYKIDFVDENLYTLVAHHIAYKLYIKDITLYNQEKLEINIQLKSNILKGEKIEVVAAEPKKWKKNIKLFEREFIGKSVNAKKCELLNPEVIHFHEDKSGILHASADSVLRVVNNTLGYKLDIILDEFQCERNQLLYSRMFPRFYEMNAENNHVQKKWNKNRQKTYTGSFKHFLTSIAAGDIDNSGFDWFQVPTKRIDIERILKTPLPPAKLKILRYNELNKISLSFPNYLVVFYGEDHSIYNWSILELREPVAFIDPNGNFYTPDAIFLEGKWYRDRVSDMLPINYHLDK